MILESRSTDERPPKDPFKFRSLLVLGLATSVDALAVGLTLALLDVPLVAAVAVIGLVTFALVVPAVHAGARLGSRLAHRAEFVGGFVLVAVGARILAEHLSGAA